MTLKTNNAEGGTDNTTVTTGNSGGTSGDAWNLVNIGTGATVTFESTGAIHGNLSMQIASTTASTTPLVEWSDTANASVTFRWYWMFNTLPNATQQIGANIRGNAGATSLARTQMDASGHIQCVCGAGSSPLTTAAMSTGTVYMVEFVCTGLGTASSAATLWLYQADGTTLIESETITGQTTSFTGDRGRFGKFNGASNIDVLYDSMALNIGSSSQLGPIATNASITAVVIDGTTQVLDTFTVIIDSDPQPSTVTTPAADLPAPTVVAQQHASVNATLISPSAPTMDPVTVSLGYDVAPAVINGVTAMDPVTVSAGTDPQPSVIAPPTSSLPAPTLTISDGPSPAAIAPPVSSLPAATVSTGSNVDTPSTITPPAPTMTAPTVDTGTHASINATVVDGTSTLPAPTIDAVSNASLTAVVIDGVSTLPAPTLATDMIVTAVVINGVTSMDPVDVDGGANPSAVVIDGSTTFPAVVVAAGSETSPGIILAATSLDPVTIFTETIVLSSLIAPGAATIDVPTIQTAANTNVGAVAILGVATLPTPDSIQSGTDVNVLAVLVATPTPTIDVPTVLAGQGVFVPVSVVDGSTSFFDPTVSGGTDAFLTATVITPDHATMDPPTITVTSSASVVAITVDGVTNFFDPTLSVQSNALLTPVVIDGQTSFPDPALQAGSIVSPGTVTPAAPTMDPVTILAGTGVFVAPVLVEPPAPTMTAPDLSTSSVVPASLVDTHAVFYTPTVHAANRFPLRMSLRKTRVYHFSVADE